MSNELIMVLVWVLVSLFVFWSVFRSLEKEIRKRQYFLLAYDTVWVIYTITGLVYSLVKYFLS